MNPRIASIENLIAQDPAGRNIFGLVVADQLRLAAQSLRLATRVGIVSGFYIPSASAGETDGPPGAKCVGHALATLGVQVDYITDDRNAPLFHALDLEPIVNVGDYLNRAHPTHLVSIERAGRGVDSRYRDMQGKDITAHTAPLDGLFIQAAKIGLTTIGIGDGGNEIGMGKVFSAVLDAAQSTNGIHRGREIATVVSTDFCIVAGVSNWGSYGLAGALAVLSGKHVLLSTDDAVADIEAIVHNGGAVDGMTGRQEATVDSLPLSHSIRVLEEIRRQTVSSPLERPAPLTVGVLGYGVTGRATTKLLASRGHRPIISDERSVTLEAGIKVSGVETGGHTLDALRHCDLVVTSPGVRSDAPIRDQLHLAGIPVMSGLELAFQLCDRPVIAVTGTVGKRSTLELLQAMFRACGRSITIGGNRGAPLSQILLDTTAGTHVSERNAIALSVSSYQLESVVQFRPHIAVILNINEAHLDRHRSVAEYIRIKSRIFMNHHPDDVLVLNYDDARVRPLARKHQGRNFFVSGTQAVDRGAWLHDDWIWQNVDGSAERIGPAKPRFAENLLAASLVARLCGLDTDQIRHALATIAINGDPSP